MGPLHAQLRKFAPWIRVTVYWTRSCVGVKVKIGDCWHQKFYFSRQFRHGALAVNITLAAKLCSYLKDHNPEHADSEVAYDHYTMLCVTAAAAEDSYQI